jgi:predicted RNA-binding Zn-ribbon protein involved in translation (DUF1610 family)
MSNTDCRTCGHDHDGHICAGTLNTQFGAEPCGCPEQMRKNCLDCGVEFTPEPRTRIFRCDECKSELNKARNLRRRAQKYDPDADLIRPIDIYTRDNWVCHICGDIVPEESRTGIRIYLGEYDPLSPSVEHVVALSEGGKHTLSNVVSPHWHK